MTFKIHSRKCAYYAVIFLHLQVVEQVEIEYVPEKAELVEGMDEEFRKIFEKFSFADVTALEVILMSQLSSSHYIFSVYCLTGGLFLYN